MNMQAQEWFNSYSERRYSRPWAALLSWSDAAGKPIYSFGTYDAKHGEKGNAVTNCKPGSVVSFGQKDGRNPRKSENEMYIVTPRSEAPEGHECSEYRSVLVDFEESSDYVLVRTTPAAARKHYFTKGDGKQ